MVAAVIDIGSNSIRCETGELKDGKLDAGKKEVLTTRLAEGIVAAGVLSETAMARTLDAIGTLLEECGGIPVFAYATSAVRDAFNASDFLGRIRARFGLKVDVLTGAQEAEYAFLAAAAPEGGLIDIGGGSTQVMTARGGESFPMGCVRAKEYAADAETLQARRKRVYERCGALMRLTPSARHFTGVGGTITTLAAFDAGLSCYDGEAVSQRTLTKADVTRLLDTLDQMGQDGRRGHPLLTQRHDVILFGGLILEYVMEKMKLLEIGVSDRDGMDGYLMEKLKELR